MHPHVTDQHGVADMLGLTGRTVVAWTKEGRIPGTQVGDRWRYWTPAVVATMSGKVTPEPDPEREVISVYDLASYLDMSVNALRVMMRDQRLPATKVGRRWMVPWAEIRDAIAAGRPLDSLHSQA